MRLQITRILETKDNREGTLRDMASFLADDQNHRVFYLVPEHMKFDMEKIILDNIQTYKSKPASGDGVAMMRLQVFSFKRLAWYFLEQNQEPIQSGLDDIGLMMLIKQILNDLQEDLLIFRRESSYIGFQEQLTQLFKEFDQGNISSQRLIEIYHTVEAEVDGQDPLLDNQLDKLRELILIYQSFENKLADQILTEQALYKQLKHYLATTDLSQVRVVVDGFYRFTANEFDILGDLLAACDQVEVILTLDSKKAMKAEFQGQDLFSLSRQSYNNLVQLAKAIDCPLMLDRVGKINEQFDPGFYLLDQTLVKDWSNDKAAYATISKEEQDQVKNLLQVWSCQTPYIEAEQVANQIYHLVSCQAYRYQDIQILTRDFDQVREQLLPYLKMNNIPYFLDDSESMADHPLFLFIDALIRIYRYDWRYEDIFNLLRTELLLPLHDSEDPWSEVESFRREVDLTENVVLQNGYEGKQWWQKGVTWSYLRVDDYGQVVASESDQKTQEIANQVKAFLAEALDGLFTAFDQASNNHEALLALYQFLVHYQIPEQLMLWAQNNALNNRLDEGRHHEQAWQAFIKVLDQYDRLFKDQSFKIQDFQEVLASAFNQTKYNMVPPTLDSVTIRGIDSQRSEHKKVTFVMALTKSNLPKAYQNHSLLTDEDREVLNHYFNVNEGLNLSSQVKTNNEKFITYKLFLSASERLYLSFPYNQLGDKTIDISPYLAYLIERFDLEVWDKKSLALPMSEKDSLVFGNWRSQLHYLIQVYQGNKSQHLAVSDRWEALKEALSQETKSRDYSLRVLQGLNHQNKVVNLSSEEAKALYGSQLAVSVSSLELYNKDPFSYFLQYGLKLRERPIFKIDERLTGSYFHRVLQEYYDLKKQSDDSFDELFSQALNTTLKDPAYDIFSANQFYNYQLEQLNFNLNRFIKQFDIKMNKTKWYNHANEASFGMKADQSYSFNLSDQTRVHLRGIIDRIDTFNWQFKGQDYLVSQITDYKSGSRAISLGDIFQGTNIQLYTYLLVCLEKFQAQNPDKKIIPFGAFYQKMSAPLKKIENQSEYAEMMEKNASGTVDLSQELKSNEYFLASQQLLEDIMEEGYDGEDLYAYGLKKDGDFDKNRSRKILTLKEFQALLDYIKEVIYNSSENIMSGDIQLRPLEDEKYLPSTTAYKSIAQFDLTEPGKHYRDRLKLSKEAFFQMIANKLNETSEEEE
ncbi:PD-(D/E)XK nuclease family protein [Aerococcus urinae]|uniref:PD-(D/E)XK nuclease family protein n=1 Tax=Aerococcus urinae TaxID=1376 RepID=UPI00254A02B8|nr:PD-(D/E)XK nuclease family protein [Aerococcus urinae]MDK7190781.1 PD-(D/E)XK nuclease family protein [Aerococcus urinae]MDK8390218.1 PD-(D/E)XK nuclease family protein [Aerococcus urinae]